MADRDDIARLEDVIRRVKELDPEAQLRLAEQIAEYAEANPNNEAIEPFLDQAMEWGRRAGGSFDEFLRPIPVYDKLLAEKQRRLKAKGKTFEARGRRQFRSWDSSTQTDQSWQYHQLHGWEFRVTATGDGWRIYESPMTLLVIGTDERKSIPVNIDSPYGERHEIDAYLCMKVATKPKKPPQAGFVYGKVFAVPVANCMRLA